MKLYGVVNMDIVGSRKLKNRDFVQLKLKSYIDHINQKRYHLLAAPITITLGDEWQLITTEPWEVYNLVYDFQRLLWVDRVDIYAGLGIGEVTTALDMDTRQMDGPCFYFARKALDIVKRGSKAKEKQISSKLNRVYFSSRDLTKQADSLIDSQTFSEIAVASIEDPPEQDLAQLLCNEVINAIIENNEIMKANLTDKQKRVFIDYLKYGSYRKMLDATAPGHESIGGISQKLNTGNYFTIQRNQALVTKLLKSYTRIMRGIR